jgi:hypothetical protein
VAPPGAQLQLGKNWDSATTSDLASFYSGGYLNSTSHCILKLREAYQPGAGIRWRDRQLRQIHALLDLVRVDARLGKLYYAHLGCGLYRGAGLGAGFQDLLENILRNLSIVAD